MVTLHYKLDGKTVNEPAGGESPALFRAKRCNDAYEAGRFRFVEIRDDVTGRVLIAQSQFDLISPPKI
jgi:hypothetical protein